MEGKGAAGGIKGDRREEEEEGERKLYIGIDVFFVPAIKRLEDRSRWSQNCCGSTRHWVPRYQYEY